MVELLSSNCCPLSQLARACEPYDGVLLALTVDRDGRPPTEAVRILFSLASPLLSERQWRQVLVEVGLSRGAEAWVGAV